MHGVVSSSVWVVGRQGMKGGVIGGAGDVGRGWW